MNDEFGGLERNIRHSVDLLSRHLPIGTEENLAIHQDSRYPGRYSNLAPTEYDTDRIENITSNSSSVVACIFVLSPLFRLIKRGTQQ
jgi:hypothetical protein